MAKRISCGIVSEDSQVTEDEAANNVGSGNIAMPEPVIKWKDKEKLLTRCGENRLSFRNFNLAEDALVIYRIRSPKR